MGKLRQYRRDEERIAKTVLERNKNIRNKADFDKEYNRYMGKAQQDPLFKQNVLKSVQAKQGDRFSTAKVKEVRRTPASEFVFVGKQQGKKKIFKARFDKNVNRYRNDKGQFVKKS